MLSLYQNNRRKLACSLVCLQWRAIFCMCVCVGVCMCVSVYVWRSFVRRWQCECFPFFLVLEPISVRLLALKRENKLSVMQYWTRIRVVLPLGNTSCQVNQVQNQTKDRGKPHTHASTVCVTACNVWTNKSNISIQIYTLGAFQVLYRFHTVRLSVSTTQLN